MQSGSVYSYGEHVQIASCDWARLSSIESGLKSASGLHNLGRPCADELKLKALDLLLMGLPERWQLASVESSLGVRCSTVLLGENSFAVGVLLIGVPGP